MVPFLALAPQLLDLILQRLELGHRRALIRGMLRDLYLLVADLLLKVVHPLDQGLRHHGYHAHVLFVLADLGQGVGQLRLRFPVVAHLPDRKQLGVCLLVFLFDLA